MLNESSSILKTQKNIKMKNIIIQKESKTGVRQWHFDRIQALTLLV